METVSEAGPGEILRAVQKDDAYLAKLSQDVSNLGLEFFGPRKWIQLQTWSDPCVRFIYYSLTTLWDYQTLGEEYTGLIQVVKGRKVLPTKLRRFLMIFCQTFGPQVLKQMTLKLEKHLAAEPNNSANKRAADSLRRLLPLLSTCFEYLDKLNLCIFYFQGVYYHLALRLLRVSYLKHSGISSSVDTTRDGFRVLGLVTLAHWTLTLVHKLYSHWSKPQQKQDSAEVDSDRGAVEHVPAGRRCPLCLDRRGARGGPACTPCGHLFCWTCILENLARQPDCPLCRQTLHPSRVVPLQNYA